MERVNGVGALKLIFEGEILEGGERYYKYDVKTNEILYSDDSKQWKTSNITINEFLKWDSWTLIK